MKKAREAISERIKAEMQETGQEEQPQEISCMEIFEKCIQPSIAEMRAAKMPSGKEMALPDVLDTSPSGMAKVTYPIGVKRLMIREARELKDPEKGTEKIREYFGFASTDFTNEEMEGILANDLENASQIIDAISKTAVQARVRNNPEDPIQEDYRFTEEILNCRDIKKLIQWMAHPSAFLEEVGKERATVLQQSKKGKRIETVIAHEARRMVEFMLIYRQHAFDEAFKNRESNRDLFEGNFLTSLKIENMKPVKINVCIGRKRNAKGELEARKKDGTWKLLHYFEGEEKPQITSAEEILDPMRKGKIDRDGYEWARMEEKKLIEATAEINGKRQKIYICPSSDGRPFDIKSMVSYISNYLREGDEAGGANQYKATDLLRCAIAVDEEEEQKMVYGFIRRLYSARPALKDSNGHSNNNDDHAPSTKKEPSIFEKNKPLTLSAYAIIPVRKAEKKHDVIHINAEMKVFCLTKMLTFWLSDEGPASHELDYKPRREFETAWRLLFPPTIYGDRFAQYVVEGYNHGQNAATVNN